MASKLKPGEFDCYANALLDEPMFVLLARDSRAPELIERWARDRQYDISTGDRPVTDAAMVDEARACAIEMRAWRNANDGKWRKS